MGEREQIEAMIKANEEQLAAARAPYRVEGYFPGGKFYSYMQDDAKDARTNLAHLRQILETMPSKGCGHAEPGRICSDCGPC